jgi:hypothetical protein
MARKGQGKVDAGMKDFNTRQKAALEMLRASRPVTPLQGGKRPYDDEETMY